VSVASLSIVIPAYNEAERLPPSLGKLLAYAARQPRRLDLVLVDDGSQDGTAQIAQQVLGDRLPLTVLVNRPNRGKGYSVRRGLLEAQGDCVLFADADFSTPIEEADRLLGAIEGGADLAIGSRGMRQSDVQVHQPWWREKAGKLFGLLTRALVLPGIWDSQCGFKCFRREVAQAVLPHQTLDGWAFDVEVLLVARKLGYTIAEVPVHWVNDPNSKVHMLTDGPRMVADMLRARWRHRGLRPTRPA
jgi:dolichyl-phosphate beta-glucosyltransferase